MTHFHTVYILKTQAYTNLFKNTCYARIAMTSLSEALIVKKYRSGFNIHSLSYEYWNSCVVKCITYIFRITLLGHSAVNNAAILFFLNYLETYVLLVLNSVLTCGICPLDVFIRICEQLLHSIRTLMTYVYNSRWRKMISKLGIISLITLMKVNR